MGCHFSFGPVVAILIFALLLSQQITALFYAFLIVILVNFTASFSRGCSYSHRSTDSNFHTVILSNLYHTLLLKKREHVYTSFIVAIQYGIIKVVVWLQSVSGCSKSMIKIQQKYMENNEPIL